MKKFHVVFHAEWDEPYEESEIAEYYNREEYEEYMRETFLEHEVLMDCLEEYIYDAEVTVFVTNR